MAGIYLGSESLTPNLGGVEPEAVFIGATQVWPEDTGPEPPDQPGVQFAMTDVNGNIIYNSNPTSLRNDVTGEYEWDFETSTIGPGYPPLGLFGSATTGATAEMHGMVIVERQEVLQAFITGAKTLTGVNAPHVAQRFTSPQTGSHNNVIERMARLQSGSGGGVIWQSDPAWGLTSTYEANGVYRLTYPTTGVSVYPVLATCVDAGETTPTQGIVDQITPTSCRVLAMNSNEATASRTLWVKVVYPNG